MYIESFTCNFISKIISPFDVFFDIETTGLSASESFVYLICTASIDCDSETINGTLMLADNYTEEKELLLKFFERIKGCSRLIGYNSDRFDINFIKTRAALYDIEADAIPASHDLYKTAKPLKKLLNLRDLKLKTVESFCGVTRNDIYSGGDLINVYRDYAAALSFSKLSDKSTVGADLSRLKDLYLTNIPTCDYERLRKMLLLHNKEDVTSLFPVYDALESISSFINGNFTVDSDSVKKKADNSVIDYKNSDSKQGLFSLTGTLFVEIKSDLDLPDTFMPDYNSEQLRIKRLSDKRFSFEVKLIQDELKLFFKDYKNYYYFPSEDMVIHKALAAYTSSGDRVPAKKDNCYIKKYGYFVPVFCQSEYEHILKRSYNDVRQYISLEDAEADLHLYLTSLIRSL